MRFAPVTSTLVLCAVGCLPRYDWVAGTGGSGGSDPVTQGGGGSGPGGGGGGGGMAVCAAPPHGLAAADGPYGAEAVYFGTPVVDPTLPGPFATQGGSVSPDGLRFVQGWPGQTVLETVRNDPLADWAFDLGNHSTFYDLRGRLTEDNLHLYTCHGAEQKCMIYSRVGTSRDDAFVATHFFRDEPPFDGPARDFAFTPSAGGVYLGFASTRVAPDDDTDVDPEDPDLWIAEVDPDETQYPPRSYVGLQELPASARDANDEPTWLSDGALTMFFQSDRDGSIDLYVTFRAATDQPFGPPVKLAFSAPGSDEAFLTMPHLSTLRAQPCGAGFAYFQRTAPFDQKASFRIPVCIGEPCAP